MLKQTLLSFITNRELIWEMAKRDLKMINKGAFLGYIWLILGPLVQTAAYVVIVSFVFRSRLGVDSGPLDYALYVLGGMVPWQIITRSLQEAPTQIRDRMELVKQVIYPIETLPLTSLIVSSFSALMTMVIFLVLNFFYGTATLGLLLIPIPAFLLIIMILGISWIFSVVGVFFKDLREMVAILIGLLVYLSPVVASPEMVGETVWRYIMFNPLSHIVICFRDIYYLQFHPWSWLIFILMAALSFILGGWVINRTKVLINQYI